MVFYSMESFQEAVIHTLRSITGHGINGNIVDAAEDAVFDIGIVALQAAKQDLDLLPLSHMVQFSVKRQAHWMNSRSL